VAALQHRKSASNADTWSAAERQKRKAWARLDPIGREAIRIECIGIIPKTSVPMQREDGNVDSRACGEVHVADFNCGLRDSADPGGGRE